DADALRPGPRTKRAADPAAAAIWAMPAPMAPAPITPTARSARKDATSTPSKFGLSPLHECRDALAVIRGLSGLALQITLQIKLLVKCIVGRRLKRPLDEGQPLGRLRRQIGGKLSRLRHQLVIVDALPDQPPGFRLLRRELGSQH